MAWLVLAIQMKSKVTGVWSGGQPGSPMSIFGPPEEVSPALVEESTPIVVVVVEAVVSVPEVPVLEVGVPVVGAIVSPTVPLPEVPELIPTVSPVPEVGETVVDEVIDCVALSVLSPWLSPHPKIPAPTTRTTPLVRTE